MNEATGFCSGECPNGQNTPASVDPEVEALLRRLEENGEILKDEPGTDDSWFFGYPNQGDVSTYYLPFIPGFHYGGNLDNMSLSLNATHPSNGETEYNLHSLYGLMMAKTT